MNKHYLRFSQVDGSLISKVFVKPASQPPSEEEPVKLRVRESPGRAQEEPVRLRVHEPPVRVQEKLKRFSSMEVLSQASTDGNKERNFGTMDKKANVSGKARGCVWVDVFGNCT